VLIQQVEPSGGYLFLSDIHQDRFELIETRIDAFSSTSLHQWLVRLDTTLQCHQSINQ